MVEPAPATGFRASELRSLTIDSFDLDAAPPTCTVEAGYSKRQKRDVQPLPDALVEPLRESGCRSEKCPRKCPHATGSGGLRVAL